jgi:hypothetical protein
MHDHDWNQRADRILQFAADADIRARQQRSQPVDVGAVATERGRVQRDGIVAFLDRGKPCVDVGALGLKSLDVGGERGRSMPASMMALALASSQPIAALRRSGSPCWLPASRATRLRSSL